MIKWLHCMLLRAMLRHSTKIASDYARAVEDYKRAIDSAIENDREVGPLLLTQMLYQSMLDGEKAVQAEYRAKLLYMSGRPALF